MYVFISLNPVNSQEIKGGNQIGILGKMKINLSYAN